MDFFEHICFVMFIYFWHKHTRYGLYILNQINLFVIKFILLCYFIWFLIWRDILTFRNIIKYIFFNIHIYNSCNIYFLLLMTYFSLFFTITKKSLVYGSHVLVKFFFLISYLICLFSIINHKNK